MSSMHANSSIQATTLHIWITRKQDSGLINTYGKRKYRIKRGHQNLRENSLREKTTMVGQFHYKMKQIQEMGANEYWEASNSPQISLLMVDWYIKVALLLSLTLALKNTRTFFLTREHKNFVFSVYSQVEEEGL